MNDLLQTILSIGAAKISPEIREKIIRFLKVLQKKAKETKNPFDDLLVSALLTIFKIEE